MGVRSSNTNSGQSIHILGNINSVPEITESNQKKKATFNVLAREAYINEKDERVENTTTIKVIANEGLAAVVEKYCKHGQELAICGKWVEGKEQEEMIATDILLLGSLKKD